MEIFGELSRLHRKLEDDVKNLTETINKPPEIRNVQSKGESVLLLRNMQAEVRSFTKEVQSKLLESQEELHFSDVVSCCYDLLEHNNQSLLECEKYLQQYSLKPILANKEPISKSEQAKDEAAAKDALKKHHISCALETLFDEICHIQKPNSPLDCLPLKWDLDRTPTLADFGLTDAVFQRIEAAKISQLPAPERKTACSSKETVSNPVNENHPVSLPVPQIDIPTSTSANIHTSEPPVAITFPSGNQVSNPRTASVETMSSVSKHPVQAGIVEIPSPPLPPALSKWSQMLLNAKSAPDTMITAKDSPQEPDLCTPMAKEMFKNSSIAKARKENVPPLQNLDCSSIEGFNVTGLHSNETFVKSDKADVHKAKVCLNFSNRSAFGEHPIPAQCISAKLITAEEYARTIPESMRHIASRDEINYAILEINKVVGRKQAAGENPVLVESDITQIVGKGGSEMFLKLMQTTKRIQRNYGGQSGEFIYQIVH